MITRKIGPALAAGNSVVIKPPSETPYTALALTKLAVEAGLPPKTIQVVPTKNRQAATELATNPLVKKISFTGSTGVGKMLAKLATGTLKKVSLELGGNAPFIVFNDADLDLAVEGAMFCKFRCSGQTCVCANRLYVQKGIAKDFTAKLVQKVAALQVGAGLSSATTQGPLVNKSAVDKVTEHVTDAVSKGAKIEIGGKTPGSAGFFYEPTVLSGVTPDSLVSKDETFGPLAPVFEFETEEDAIKLANDTEFGLAGYFFSKDIGRAMRVAQRLQVGMVGVNTGKISAAEAPFGGVKESGYGKEGSLYGLEEYQKLNLPQNLSGYKISRADSAFEIPIMSRTYNVASIPGDGIGVEVIEHTVKVIRALEQRLGSFSVRFTTFDWSSERYKQVGSYMPEDGLETLKEYDAILFGAVGSPDVPDHISLWGLILPIRKRLDQYVNVRPITVLPGLSSPLKDKTAAELDWIMIRENSEGEYAGQGGTTHDDTPYAIANDVSVFTRIGIERTMRFAFETAQNRPRKKLTMVTKSNAQRHGMVLWDKVFEELVPQYPEVQTDKMLVDAMTVRMVLKPESLDTIVATNLHGDILSDLAAALAGSIGVAPSSNLNPTRKYPSMFEPIHGSAPDITGKGIANPVGTFWSAAEMLRWLGEGEAAADLMEAIKKVLDAGIRTRDVGGTANTAEVTDAVVQALLDAS
ncbi:tartrate dehydrogenase [Annulohypoxylon truncatum]|uniref:tartrate dehydrogenase n=1 Tax=Annulohypoxylon truncatum TaxID=327061 RepID=UPI0020077D69|nr:tartrate dehydrogenase [Annulohypoxylon truncatum]KAI1213738.1 tartrate dehydrogenase [Annulohypoxylon truncatum]